MKTLTVNHRHLPTSPLAAIGAFLAQIGRERRTRRDIARLESMDDHILRDIGLHRGAIRDSLRHGRDWRIRCR